MLLSFSNSFCVNVSLTRGCVVNTVMLALRHSSLQTLNKFWSVCGSPIKYYLKMGLFETRESQESVFEKVVLMLKLVTEKCGI